MGSISDCVKSAVLEIASTVREMILLSVAALQSSHKNAALRLHEMDDTVDALYRKYLGQIITPSHKENQSEEISQHSALLILRYLECISDHACYVGNSINYIVTGISRTRR